MFVKVTGIKGTPHWINPHLVADVSYDEDEDTSILLVGDTEVVLSVKESPEEVVALLEAALNPTAAASSVDVAKIGRIARNLQNAGELNWAQTLCEATRGHNPQSVSEGYTQCPCCHTVYNVYGVYWQEAYALAEGWIPVR